MADGKNDARALRILEIMNDFTTLTRHITAQTNRAAPDAEHARLIGYALLRQCAAESQALLASPFKPESVGLPQDLRGVPGSDQAKLNLQKVIVDAASRRFRAHKIYLRSSAATRWIQWREQVTAAAKPEQWPAALQRLDQRLADEIRNITDASIFSDLRAADRRKNYWLDDDPSLDRILAWNRSS